ncbi:MAG: hypothetical protein PWQ57_2850 [Desulfovibrionales bacterium]|nr:hypothetical protein [Desulfovibrionales bacterium]
MILPKKNLEFLAPHKKSGLTARFFYRDRRVSHESGNVRRAMPRAGPPAPLHIRAEACLVVSKPAALSRRPEPTTVIQGSPPPSTGSEEYALFFLSLGAG